MSYVEKTIPLDDSDKKKLLKGALWIFIIFGTVYAIAPVGAKLKR